MKKKCHIKINKYTIGLNPDTCFHYSLKLRNELWRKIGIVN